eukprot:m51a1_g8010 hypothetical protein (349) ;mRNA; f:174249-175842
MSLASFLLQQAGGQLNEMADVFKEDQASAAAAAAPQQTRAAAAAPAAQQQSSSGRQQSKQGKQGSRRQQQQQQEGQEQQQQEGSRRKRTVLSVRFRSFGVADPALPSKAALALGQLHEQRDTMNAYVVLASDPECAAAVAELDGVAWRGKHLRVDRAEGGGQLDHRTTVFVGALPYDAQEEALRALFADCGPVRAVRVVRDAKAGSCLGYAFVSFASRDAVQLALLKNGAKACGRSIRVTRCLKDPKARARAHGSDAPARQQQQQQRGAPWGRHHQQQQQQQGKPKGPARAAAPGAGKPKGAKGPKKGPKGAKGATGAKGKRAAPEPFVRDYRNPGNTSGRPAKRQRK